MTKREFEQVKVNLSLRQFQSTEMDPLVYGMQRLLFQKARMEQLIAAAESVGLKTTNAMAVRWKRIVQRADLSLAHFSQLKKERDAGFFRA